jgi:prevent-host-death family protein
MISLNIHEAKTHLSRYLHKLEKGQKILLCRRNTPIAVITPVKAQGARKRVIGLAKGEFVVPDSFFEPLPAELLDSFAPPRP